MIKNYTDSLIESVAKDLYEAYMSQYIGNSKPELAKQFYSQLKNNVIDLEAFHQAFDTDLDKAGLLDLFATNGKLAHRGTYGTMKNYTDQSAPMIIALKKLWAAQYVNNLKSLADLDEIKKREQEKLEREAREKAEREAKALALKQRQEDLDAKIPEVEKLLDQTLYTELKTLVPYPEMSQIVIKEDTARNKIYIYLKSSSNYKTSGQTNWGHMYGAKSDSIQDLADALNKQLPNYVNELKAAKIVDNFNQRKEVQDIGADIYYYEDNGNYIRAYVSDNTLYIEDILTKKQLDAIPTTAKLVAVCKSGAYSTGRCYYHNTNYYSYSSDIPDNVLSKLGWEDHADSGACGSTFTTHSGRTARNNVSKFYFGPEVDSWATGTNWCDSSD